jgi:hypothetical protein
MESALQAVAGVTRVESGLRGAASDGWRRFILHRSSDVDPREALFDLAKERGWRLRDLHREELTLEQIFRALTGAVREGEAPDA